MSKLGTVGLSLALLGAGAAPAAVLGPDAAACAGGQPSILVHVEGFKQRTGGLRVQVYGSNPEDFLAKGRKLKRIDLPVSERGPMDVCVAVPGPGNYAVAVRHDVDGSGKSSWNDGGGFTRNPELSLLSLKPAYDKVVVHVGRATLTERVVLQYRRGLSIAPVRAG